MENIQTLSIILEALIVLISLGIAGKRGKKYGWGLALTFAVYTWYDAVRLYDWQVSSQTMTWAFLIATLSALWSVWSIYKHSR